MNVDARFSLARLEDCRLLLYLQGVHFWCLYRRYTWGFFMRIESEIKKWGNSLALRITGPMAEIPKFREGCKVSVEVTEKGLIIEAVKEPKKRIKLPFSEADLVAGMTPETAHADELATLSDVEIAD